MTLPSLQRGIQYNTWRRTKRKKISSQIIWERQKERQTQYLMNYEVRLWKARQRLRLVKNSVYKILGGYVCRECGYCDNIHALQVDHIQNTGYLDRLTKGSATSFYYYYKNHPIEAYENLQILCANCNMIKAYKTKQQNKKKQVKGRVIIEKVSQV